MVNRESERNHASTNSEADESAFQSGWGANLSERRRREAVELVRERVVELEAMLERAAPRLRRAHRLRDLRRSPARRRRSCPSLSPDCADRGPRRTAAASDGARRRRILRESGRERPFDHSNRARQRTATALRRLRRDPRPTRCTGCTAPHERGRTTTPSTTARGRHSKAGVRRQPPPGDRHRSRHRGGDPRGAGHRRSRVGMSIDRCDDSPSRSE